MESDFGKTPCDKRIHTIAEKTLKFFCVGFVLITICLVIVALSLSVCMPNCIGREAFPLVGQQIKSECSDFCKRANHVFVNLMLLGMLCMLVMLIVVAVVLAHGGFRLHCRVSKPALSITANTV